MSTEIREVRSRIAGTRQIRKVTDAMRKVAAARLVRDRRATAAAQGYMARLREVLEEVCRAAPEIEHPLLSRGAESGIVTLVAFGSDRGLCGGFNSELMEIVQEFVAQRRGRQVALILVGSKLGRRAGRLGLAVERIIGQPLRADWPGGVQGERGAGAEALERLARSLAEAFLSGRSREVYLLYARFLSGLRRAAAVERLLPMPLRPVAPGGPQTTLFEPEPAALLARLLPEFLRESVRHAFLNSVAAENAARQVAMSRATQNAADMLRGLIQAYSRLRQDSITTQMIELTSHTFAARRGAGALAGARE